MRYLLALGGVLVALCLSITMPQNRVRAATVTYNTCPTFATLETDASTAGVITFDIGVPCTVNFDNEILIEEDVIIETSTQVIFNGMGSNRHFYVDSGGSLTLRFIDLTNASHPNTGGSIYNNGGTLVLYNVYAHNNTAQYGAVIYNNGGSVTLSESSISDNTASDSGGVIDTFDGIVSILNTDMGYNTAQTGGGGTITAYESTVIINNSDIYRNSAGASGGAMTLFGSTLTLTNSRIDLNDALLDGGAISIANTVATITGGRISGNRTMTWGGAIFASDVSLTIRNASIYDNFATLIGGGLYLIQNTSALLENSTLVTNSASNFGGALSVRDLSSVTITHVTFVDNDDTLFVEDSATTVFASILQGGACSTGITDLGNNIAFNATGCPGTNTNPLLGLWAGVAYPLLDGSPAVDIYNAPCAVGTDQLGTARPQGAGCDAGAVEGGSAGDPTNPAPSVGTGPEVLGCVFSPPNGVEVANVPDNTYCTMLMRNNSVVNFSGAVPSDLLGLGVILAVDVFRIEGGQSINTFPTYGRVCLRGAGRMFYMDGRNAPRFSIEMPTERIDNLTCAWIPAPGTLLLTNP